MAGSSLAATCPPTPGGGNVCTANDFNITIADVVGADGCTDGEIIPFVNAQFILDPTAAQRFDIGLFVGDAGQPVLDGASCSFISLRPLGPPVNLNSGVGGYRDLDGDACGDVDASDPAARRDFVLTNVLCRDSDGDGRVDISGLVTWFRNAQSGCADPTDETNFFPEQSSDCQIITPDLNLPIVVEPPPAMTVNKVALPVSLPAPGGPVLFVVTVTNTSSETDPLTLQSLADDVYGDITQVQGRVIQTSCEVPQQISPRDTYLCEFVGQVTGTTGFVETDTVTVTAVDDEGEQLVEVGDATVTIASEPPSMRVVKNAAPRLVKEPGGEVTYFVQVYNTSDSESIDLSSLDDDLYGNVFTKGTCILPLRSVVLAPGEYFTCTFEEQVAGETGDVITDTVTANADWADGVLVADDSANVVITDAVSAIAVEKIASPPELPEPGGTFRFIVQIQNLSPVDSVTIDQIVDNIYGDVTSIPGTTCVVPQSLDPGATYQCDFPGDFAGSAGDTQVDQVVASGTDNEGDTVSSGGQALVVITDVLSEIQVIKNATPTEVAAPGGTVTFEVTVANVSQADGVTIDSLVDDVYGDITQVQGRVTGTTCAVPQQIPAGGTYQCAFDGQVTGSAGFVETDTVSASGTDDDGGTVAGSDSAVVTVVSTPPSVSEIRVTKIARPTTVEEPGGEILYVIVIENRSQNDRVRLETIQDDIYGDLGDPANPLIEIVRGCDTGDADAIVQPNGVSLCLFRAESMGVAGDRVTDTVTVNACVLAGDDCSSTVLDDSDTATVSITRGPSTIEVFKTANPTNIVEPGGPVDFAVEVINTSVSAVITIDSLVDDIYGDVTQLPPPSSGVQCTVPQTLPAGNTYRCAFTAEVPGSNGDRVKNVVSASGTDDRDPPEPVSAQNDAEVAILGSPPTLDVTKTPNPTVVQVPGDLVTFSVTVENTSAAATLEITTLRDDVYGDLNGLGDCAVPLTLTPGETYRCSFPGDVVGDQPGLHDNTVSASGNTEDNRFATDQARAIVLIRDLADATGVPVGSLWMLLATALALLLAAGVHFGRQMNKGR